MNTKKGALSEPLFPFGDVTSKRSDLMRTLNVNQISPNVNNTFVPSATLQPVADGIDSNFIVEMRGTLTRNKNKNCDLFYFRGGKVARKRDQDDSTKFGFVRPFPRIKKKGEFLKDEDGNFAVNPVWVKAVSKPAAPNPELAAIAGAWAAATAEQKAEWAALPQFAAILPQLKQDPIYQDFCFRSYLKELGFEHDQAINRVAFTFTVPQKFHDRIEEIQEMVNEKQEGEHYSFVLRFDIRHMNMAVDLKEEYVVEEDGEKVLFKQIPIIPTYIGWVEGLTLDENTKFVDPEQAGSAFNKACQSASDKAQYISIDTMRSESARIAESIGTGKKAHLPLRDAIFEAAMAKDEAKLQTAAEALRLIEERGANPKVGKGYTDSILKAAHEKLLVSMGEQEVGEPAPGTTPKKHRSIEFEVVDEDEEPQTAFNRKELETLLGD